MATWADLFREACGSLQEAWGWQHVAAGQVADTDGHFCALTGAQGRQRQPRRNGECWSTALGASCCSGGPSGQPRVVPGFGSAWWHQAPTRTRHTRLYTCAHTYVHIHPHVHIDAHCCYNFHLFNPITWQKANTSQTSLGTHGGDWQLGKPQVVPAQGHLLTFCSSSGPLLVGSLMDFYTFS